jgi:hypothetical protein
MRSLTFSVALAFAVAIFAACDIDGETFGVELVNDLQVPVDFHQCSTGDCDDVGERSASDVPSGKSVSTVGVVDVVSWYEVIGPAGSLGCLRIDFDSRPHNVRIMASAVEPCPR